MQAKAQHLASVCHTAQPIKVLKSVFFHSAQMNGSCKPSDRQGAQSLSSAQKLRRSFHSGNEVIPVGVISLCKILFIAFETSWFSAVR